MSLADRRVASLEKVGALDFAKRLCRRHGAELDRVLNTRIQGTRERRARRELYVVVMHTLDLDHSDAARTFIVTRSTVQNAEKNRLRAFA
jgi:hypothetical protein